MASVIPGSRYRRLFYKYRTFEVTAVSGGRAELLSMNRKGGPRVIAWERVELLLNPYYWRLQR